MVLGMRGHSVPVMVFILFHKSFSNVEQTILNLVWVPDYVQNHIQQLELRLVISCNLVKFKRRLLVLRNKVGDIPLAIT